MTREKGTTRIGRRTVELLGLNDAVHQFQAFEVRSGLGQARERGGPIERVETTREGGRQSRRESGERPAEETGGRKGKGSEEEELSGRTPNRMAWTLSSASRSLTF